MHSAGVKLTPEEQTMLDGGEGEGVAMAMRIVVAFAQSLGAASLLPVASAHVDGCLYHGESGTLFAERLVHQGSRIRIPASLNVGALDLHSPGRERLPESERELARRMMNAYVALGCSPTWTCAPYQAGHRPERGSDVAWGESNAVAFCNSVLGARTNRYGDFLDICAALTARAPRFGLHLEENRWATVLVDATSLPEQMLEDDLTFALVGAWLGGTIGTAIAAFEGLGSPTEDQLKALGAGAASTGSVALFHVIGVTPEAADRGAAFGGEPPQKILHLTPDSVRAMRAQMSTAPTRIGEPVDAVAVGSPHLSFAELQRVAELLAGRTCAIPFYACTGRHALAQASRAGVEARLRESGVIIVSDTCIVVTPILAPGGGILLTNSAKFAHYVPPNTGHTSLLAPLRDCVETAVAGKLVLDDGPVT